MTSALPLLREDLLGFRRRPRRDPEAIARLRDERVRRVVEHAARNVPYYQRLFAEARLDPRDIHNARDLALLPLSSKQALQDLPLEERVARGLNPEQLVRHSTSGSTGLPMVILRTRLEEALIHAYQLRSQLVLGVPLRARRAKVGKTYEPGLLHRLGLLPTFAVDALEQTPAQILAQLLRRRPDCIDLRPGVLELLVDEAERNGRKDWPWRWIVCGGEVLYPDLLHRAERVFRARILERYGAHEVGQIAWRCTACETLHTNDDSVVVEILKDGEQAAAGETGEVVVSGLLSYAMPFLRFRLGDLSELRDSRGPASCAFGFGRIGAVQGRQIDNFELPDGRSFPTFGIMAAVRQSASVKRFQLIQQSLEEIRIRYECADDESHDPAEELVRKVRQALPAPMLVSAERVTGLQPGPSGKFRYVLSRTPAPPASLHTRP